MKIIECKHWSMAGKNCGICAIGKFKRPSHGVCTQLCVGKLVDAPSNVIRERVGPGTELANLIKHHLPTVNMMACNGCRELADKMDEWGSDECLNHIDEIEAAMIENSKKKVGRLFNWIGLMAVKMTQDWTPRSLIEQAIENARQQPPPSSPPQAGDAEQSYPTSPPA